MDEILSFNHFNISVSDMEASLVFYRDVLGLTCTGRGTVAYPHLDDIVGLQGTVIEWAELAVPAGGLVELFRYEHPVGVAVDPTVNNPGTTHLAFTVRNLDGLCARIQQAGYRTQSAAPVRIPLGDWEGWHCLYVQDPDGVAIELSEPA